MCHPSPQDCINRNKNNLISVILPLIFSSCEEEESSVFAQSMQVSGDAYVYGNPGMPIASHIVVKNITTDTLGVMCEKIIIDTAAGTSNYFCWGTSCWPSSTYVSPIPAGVRLIPPGFEDSTMCSITQFVKPFPFQKRRIRSTLRKP